MDTYFRRGRGLPERPQQRVARTERIAAPQLNDAELVQQLRIIGRSDERLAAFPFGRFQLTCSAECANVIVPVQAVARIQPGQLREDCDCLAITAHLLACERQQQKHIRIVGGLLQRLAAKALGVRRAQEQEDQDRKNGKHSSRVP